MEDFAVSFAIHNGTTATVLGDLHNPATGLEVGVPFTEPEDVLRRVTTDSPFVAGDFEVIATPAAGRLEVILTVEGATWAQVNARYRTAREWWRQSGSFWLDVELQGDGLRYVARRPDVTPSRIDSTGFIILRRSFALSFPVQPNPVVI